MKFIILTLLLACSQNIAFANIEQYGPTQTNETLWSIANQYKKPNMTMTQLMLAFFNSNPGAFYNGNMNRLKQGVYLKVPTDSQVKNTDFNTAKIIIDQKIKQYERFYEKFTAKPNFKSLNQSTTETTKKTHQIKEQPKAEPKNLTIESVKTETQNTIQTIKNTLNQEANEQKAKRIDPSTLFNYGQPLKFSYGYDVSMSYDDNIRLAQIEDDIRDDYTFNALYKIDTGIKVSRLSRFKLGASIELNTHATFEELNNIQYSINSNYIFATTSKFGTPIYIIKLSLSGLESNSDMRSSNIHKIGLNINKRLTSQIHFTGGFQYKQRESQSDVFDTNEKIVLLNLDYSFNRKTLIYGTYHYIKGDKISSSTPSLAIINASDAIEPDDAFGGISLNQFAYKVDASSHVATIGFNKRSSRKLSYDISLRYVTSESRKNNNIIYDRTILRAGILGKF